MTARKGRTTIEPGGPDGFVPYLTTFEDGTTATGEMRVDPMAGSSFTWEERDRQTPSTHRPLWGAALTGGVDPTPWEAELSQLAGVPDLRLQVRRTFNDSVAQLRQQLERDEAAGRASFVSFKLQTSWAAAKIGAADAYVTDMAAEIANATQEVWYAIHHEPEGDGPAADYLGMIRRCMPLMAARISTGRKHPCQILMAYTLAPGGFTETDFVDPDMIEALGVDGYNRWASGPSYGWREPAAVFQAAVDYAVDNDLDVVVGETGVRATDRPRSIPNPKPRPPGSSGGQWIRNLWAWGCNQANRVKVISYFNSSLNPGAGTGDPLDGERERAFAEVLAEASA